MKAKILAFFLLALLLFGCIGNGEKISEEKNTSIAKEKTEITIIKETTSQKPAEEEMKKSYEDIASYSFSPGDKDFLYFFNVGYEKKHGEAILFQKGDLDILIDTGPEEKINDLLSWLYPRVDDIELLILTNGEPGNIEGAKKIIDNFDIAEIWWNGNENDEKLVEVINYAKKKGIKTTIVKRNDERDFNGVKVSILSPGEESIYPSIDDMALVTKITDGDACFMLTSSILATAQANLVNVYKENLQCDVFQVPGFAQGWSVTGAYTAQAGALITQVSPKIAILVGSAYDPDNSRETIRIYLDLKKAEVHEVYKHNKGVVIEYDGNYAVRGLE